MNAGNTNAATTPRTLMEAVKFFADLEVAHSYFASMRWPTGPACPHCGSVEVRYLAKYRRFQCSSNHPKRQFTVKTQTVMEDSPLGLDKWAVCFWLEVNAKNSVSSYEIHRALGVTQKSAWFVLHRVRLALRSGSMDKMGGSGNGVEADETAIGGAARFMHKSKRAAKIKGTGSAGKTIVMGLLERHTDKKSKVRAVVLPDIRHETMYDVIHKHVEKGTPLYTDSLPTYQMIGTAFAHQFVNHAEKYVEGNVHTNGLENFWALFKRCIKGTHVSIEPFHLTAYLDSECFRFNNREVNDGERFALALKGIEGKRLTYKALTGASEGLAANDNSEAGGSLPN